MRISIKEVDQKNKDYTCCSPRNFWGSSFILQRRKIYLKFSYKTVESSSDKLLGKDVFLLLPPKS